MDIREKIMCYYTLPPEFFTPLYLSLTATALSKEEPTPHCVFSVRMDVIALVVQNIDYIDEHNLFNIKLDYIKHSLNYFVVVFRIYLSFSLFIDMATYNMLLIKIKND
jgi:hypothetical protein